MDSDIKIFRDGNQWCAMCGPDLQSGIGGFGNTQLEAALNFAREWKSNNRRKRKESFKQWQSKQERELHEWRKSLLNGRLEGWKSTSNRLKGIDERGIT